MLDVGLSQLRRYKGSERRGDKVIGNQSMQIGAEWFSLCAFVQHRGVGANQGHYVTTIRDGDVWETRHDAHCTPLLDTR